jgi:CBS domain-containing protein
MLPSNKEPRARSMKRRDVLIAQILIEKGSVVHSVGERVSLAEAARELHARAIGCVVVLDQSGKLVGILSERDIVREVARHGAGALTAPVTSAMTRHIYTATTSDTVQDGLERMTDRRIRHLPVLHEGRLVGLVSIGDLVKRKIREVEGEAEAMRAYIAAG